jgi:hypothetical protein
MRLEKRWHPATENQRERGVCQEKARVRETGKEIESVRKERRFQRRKTGLSIEMDAMLRLGLRGVMFLRLRSEVV